MRVIHFKPVKDGWCGFKWDLLGIIKVVSASFCLLTTGCRLPPEDAVPMQAVWKVKDSGNSSDTLIVFLPGRYDKPGDFISNGFVNALWMSGIDADVVLPDAHLGYYYRRTFSTRLQEDIIAPARRLGYKKIWAVGVSLGGFGALMFERDHPGTWQGVVLIAPFPGDQKATLEKIHNASDLQAADLDSTAEDDNYTENFWSWLQNYEREPAFPIFLGYGEQDRMKAEHELIAQILPPQATVTQPGGHDWRVWQELWMSILPILPI